MLQIFYQTSKISFVLTTVKFCPMAKNKRYLVIKTKYRLFSYAALYNHQPMPVSFCLVLLGAAFDMFFVVDEERILGKPYWY